jgi:hypothetical protein
MIRTNPKRHNRTVQRSGHAALHHVTKPIHIGNVMVRWTDQHHRIVIRSSNS